jgi:hypothetical protein
MTAKTVIKQLITESGGRIFGSTTKKENISILGKVNDTKKIYSRSMDVAF